MNRIKRGLGLAKRVRIGHQRNVIDQTEEFARCSVDDECQKLLESLRDISMTIYKKVTGQDCPNDFSSFHELLSGITDHQDRLCMSHLMLVFKYLGIEDALNDYRTFKVFVEKSLV